MAPMRQKRCKPLVIRKMNNRNIDVICAAVMLEGVDIYGFSLFLGHKR